MTREDTTEGILDGFEVYGCGGTDFCPDGVKSLSEMMISAIFTPASGKKMAAFIKIPAMLLPE